MAFPGGFGTLDELCEILTLSQTRKLARPIPVLLYSPRYWNELINFQALVRHEMISPDDLNLFRFVDSPEEAFRALREGLSQVMAPTTPAFAKTVTCCAPMAGTSADCAAPACDSPQQPFRTEAGHA